MLLRTWREQQRLSCAEAAALLGISGRNPARTYQRLETGERRLTDLALLLRVQRVTRGKVTAQDFVALYADQPLRMAA